MHSLPVLPITNVHFASVRRGVGALDAGASSVGVLLVSGLIVAGIAWMMGGTAERNPSGYRTATQIMEYNLLKTLEELKNAYNRHPSRARYEQIKAVQRELARVRAGGR